MFRYAKDFNQDISGWNVPSSRVTTGLDSYASETTNHSNDIFNDSDLYYFTINHTPITGRDVLVNAINDWFDDGSNKYKYGYNITNWDVSNVTDMSGLIGSTNYTTSFNENISGWDVSNVTNMKEMFKNAESFHQHLNSWDVSSVTNMYAMFDQAIQFNGNIGNWDVSSVTDMRAMFRAWPSTGVFNQDIGGWDVSNVTNMFDLFANQSNFNQPLNNWDVSSVISMLAVFLGCHNFNQPLNSWDVSSVERMENMFYDCSVFDQNISSWTVTNVINMKGMFLGAIAFNQDINTWDVSNVANISEMFKGAQQFDQDISEWNLSLTGVDYTNYGLNSGHSDTLFEEDSSMYYFIINVSSTVVISTTTDSMPSGDTDGAIYVSILTTNDQDIIVDAKLYDNIDNNEIKYRLLAIDPSHENIKVKLHTSNNDAVYFTEVKITFNEFEYKYTKFNSTWDSSSIGVEDTVGWLDGHSGGIPKGPEIRYYTNISKTQPQPDPGPVYPIDITVSVSDSGETAGIVYASFLTTMIKIF